MPGKTKHARLKRRTKAPAALRPEPQRTTLEGEGRTWVALPDPHPGMRQSVYVSFARTPDAEALEEARCHLAALEANHQITRDDQPGRRGATHAIEKDAKGHRRLVRRRLQAR